MQIQLNNRTILLCTVVALGGYAFVRGGGTLDGVRGLVTRGGAADTTRPFVPGGNGQLGPGDLRPTDVRPAGDANVPNVSNGPNGVNGPAVPAYGPNAATGGRSYSDPDGRFSVRVPDGWQAAPQNGGVVLSRDAATVVVSPFGNAATGEQVVSAMAQQYGQQWRGLQLVNRGQYALGGVPSAYAMFQGTDPKGRQMMLRLVGAVGPNGALALILSVPSQEFNADASTLQGIETSVAWH